MNLWTVLLNNYNFFQIGILCCHYLRNIHYVKEILEKYIMKRWTKGVIERQNVDIPFVSSCDEFGLASSLWRIQMVRNFHKLISTSEDNMKARQYCEEVFESAKMRVIDEVGAVYFEEESDSIFLF